VAVDGANVVVAVLARRVAMGGVVVVMGGDGEGDGDWRGERWVVAAAVVVGVTVARRSQAAR
jgi:hypothetical protein